MTRFQAVWWLTQLNLNPGLHKTSSPLAIHTLGVWRTKANEEAEKWTLDPCMTHVQKNIGHQVLGVGLFNMEDSVASSSKFPQKETISTSGDLQVHVRSVLITINHPTMVLKQVNKIDTQKKIKVLPSGCEHESRIPPAESGAVGSRFPSANPPKHGWPRAVSYPGGSWWGYLMVTNQGHTLRNQFGIKLESNCSHGDGRSPPQIGVLSRDSEMCKFWKHMILGLG